MDTRTVKARKSEPAAAVQSIDPVAEAIQRLRQKMPMAYAAVHEKAREIGDDAFALVRRAARGEPRCFYAVEAGQVVGTPWDLDLPTGVAELAARFGLSLVIMWGEPGGAHGTH